MPYAAITYRVKPGHEEEFLRLLAPVLDAMRHEATFVNAALHRDPEDPTRFMLYETWADRDDLLEVQMKRAYRSAYEARLPEILREPRRAEVWRRLRGDFAFVAAPRCRLLLDRSAAIPATRRTTPSDRPVRPARRTRPGCAPPPRRSCPGCRAS